MTPHNKPFKIIFMGTPAFAVPSLAALLACNEEVVAVVTQPDRPKGRGRKLTPPPVKELALGAGLPVLQPDKIRGANFLMQLKEYRPDLLVVAAYGKILPGDLLNMPSLGTINVHGSLLPKYRGAAPVQWAIINGESETGITIMQMDEGMDTGDILLPKKVSIAHDDTSASLMAKLSTVGGAALTEALNLLHKSELIPAKQDDSQATSAPPLTKDMARIDWSKSAWEISCLIRGLDPWPMAHTMLANKRLRLFRPLVVDNISEGDYQNSKPGALCRADSQGLLVTTGKDYLLLREVQLEGGKRMNAGSFLSGHPLTTGQVLDEPTS